MHLPWFCTASSLQNTWGEGWGTGVTALSPCMLRGSWLSVVQIILSGISPSLAACAPAPPQAILCVLLCCSPELRGCQPSPCASLCTTAEPLAPGSGLPPRGQALLAAIGEFMSLVTEMWLPCVTVSLPIPLPLGIF